MRHRILLACLAWLPLVSAAEAPPELRELTAKYRQAVARIEAPLAALRADYEKELAEMETDAQQAGELSEMLAIQRESRSYRNRLENIPEKHSALRKAARNFDAKQRELLKSLRPELDRLENVYLEQMGKLQGELTKSDRLDEALFVREHAQLLTRGEPPREDLVAHWELDGNARDGNVPPRFHGRASGRGPDYVHGRIGTGAVRVGQDRYLSVPHRPELNLLHPFTISAWFYLEPGASHETGAPIVAKGNESWRLQLGENGQGVGLRLKTGVSALAAESAAEATEEGKWQHAAAVFTGKDIFVYLDGVRVAEDGKDAYETTHENEEDVGIGFNPGMPERSFHGAIDDVRLYNRALKPNEVRVLAGGEGLGRRE